MMCCTRGESSGNVKLLSTAQVNATTKIEGSRISVNETLHSLLNLRRVIGISLFSQQSKRDLHDLISEARLQTEDAAANRSWNWDYRGRRDCQLCASAGLQKSRLQGGRNNRPED